MNIRYIKLMATGLALLFVFQGCSFYAGFSTKQKSSPRSVDDTKTAANVQQEEGATN